MKLVQTAHIDRHSIPPGTYNQLTRMGSMSIANPDGTPHLTPFIGDFYDFHFNPVVFTHALMLMGTDARRLGVDLGDYLSAVCYFLRRRRPYSYIQLNQGSPDYRRRASENLGVGLSSLFMVSQIGIRWETIAQIPANQKLSRLTPDFVGYTESNKLVLFEAKGTSSLQSIEKNLAKACEQVKSYPQSAQAKLAVTCYFSGEVTTFNSFMFVADPLASTIPVPERREATNLHFLSVLDLIGAAKTKDAFAQYIRLLRAAHQAPESERPSQIKKRLLRQRQIMLSTANEEFADLDRFDFQEKPHLGRRMVRDVFDHKLTVFAGCAESTLRSYIEYSEADFPKAPQFEMVLNRAISLFTDGTIFEMRWEGEEVDSRGEE